MRTLVLCALATRIASADTLTVAFDTTPNGGAFAPRNVVAVWIENSAGQFIKTIDRWANVRKVDLVAWTAASGSDTDAVSGATRLDHSQRITAMWDLKDRAGAIVPDGTYTIRMELADANVTQPAQNHQGTFTFVKSATGSTQNALANGGFQNVDITFTVAAQCNNGAVDPGETCDGNCPTTCAPSGDACMPVQLVGSAATCDAACVAQPITECVSGDGCCADGCDASNDADCVAAPTYDGGCSAGSGSSIVWALAVLFVVIRRRR